MIILSLEKEAIVLEKNLEKVLNFGYKTPHEPCNLILFLCQMCIRLNKRKKDFLWPLPQEAQISSLCKSCLQCSNLFAALVSTVLL